MSDIDTALFFQQTPAAHTSGFRRAFASGFGNIWFDEDYIADVNTSAHPLSVFANMRLDNRSDRPLYMVSIDPSRHSNATNLSQDGDNLANQSGNASETYNSCYFEIIPSERISATLLLSGHRHVRFWHDEILGSNGITFSAATSHVPRTLARNTFDNTTGVLSMSSCRDYDTDTLNLVASGELQGSMDGWTDQSGGKASVTPSGIKILAGGAAVASGVNDCAYGIYQTWTGSKREDLLGRWRRFRCDWKDTGSPDLDFVSSGCIDVSASITSSYHQERWWSARSDEDTSGFEFSMTPEDESSWEPVPASGIYQSLYFGASVRFTSQEVLPKGRVRFRMRQLHYDEYDVYLRHSDLLLCDDTTVWSDTTPTFNDRVIAFSGNGGQHFMAEAFDVDDEGSAYKLSLTKSNASASVTATIDEEIDEVVYTGDRLSYKVMPDSMCVDNGFWVGVKFSDGSSSSQEEFTLVDYQHWHHVEVNLDAYAGKTISYIQLHFDDTNSETGFCCALFNHIQIFQNLQRFNGHQFRLDCELLQNSISGTETWAEATAAGHVYGNTDGQYTNGNGFIMVIAKSTYAPGVIVESYAYIDTDQISEDDVWESFEQYLRIPYSGPIDQVSVFIGFWGDNTQNNGGYMMAKNIRLEPTCRLYGRLCYSLDEATTYDGTPTFKTVSDYDDTAWSVDLVATYFDEDTDT